MKTIKVKITVPNNDCCCNCRFLSYGFKKLVDGYYSYIEAYYCKIFRCVIENYKPCDDCKNSEGENE
jgi:hypothetical protein